MLSILLWALGGAAAGSPISAALGPLSSSHSGAGNVSLREACNDARAETNWQVFTRLRRSLGSNSRSIPKRDSDWTELILPGIAVVAIVGLYAEFAVIVSNVMFWTSAFALVITVIVFMVLFLRKTFDARQLGWSLFATFFFAIAGAYGSFLIIEPPLHNVRDLAIAGIDRDGLLPGIMPYLGPLAMQLFGVLCIYILLVSSVALCIATVSAALMSVRAHGSSWLWKFSFWLTGWATTNRLFIWLFFLGAIGILCIHGLGYETLGRIPDFITSIIDAILIFLNRP